MYNANKAALYWGHERLNAAKSLNEAVGYLNKPNFVNEAYTLWEETVLQTILNNRNHEVLMDLACGVGRFTNTLLNTSSIKKLYAVDVTPEMLNICKSNVIGNKKDIVEYICSDSSNMNVQDGSVDCVICLGLLEHLPSEWRIKTLNEISRILSSKGTLILEINNNKSMFLAENKDNKFRKDAQLDNGYFCGLTDLQEIEEHLKTLNMTIKSSHSNSYFSLIYHILLDIQNTKEVDNNIINKWMKNAHVLDQSNNSVTDNVLADQLILEIEKR